MLLIVKAIENRLLWFTAYRTFLKIQHVQVEQLLRLYLKYT